MGSFDLIQKYTLHVSRRISRALTCKFNPQILPIRKDELTFDGQVDALTGPPSFTIDCHARVLSGRLAGHLLQDQAAVTENDASCDVVMDLLILWEREKTLK